MAEYVRVQEAGDPGDPTRADAQHVDPDELEPVAFRISPEPGEGRLPVRAKRHQSPWSGEHPIGEEAADVVATMEPSGERWHGEPGVHGQQFHELRHVGALPSPHEGVHELALATPAEGIELGLLRLLRHTLADSPAS